MTSPEHGAQQECSRTLRRFSGSSRTGRSNSLMAVPPSGGRKFSGMAYFSLAQDEGPKTPYRVSFIYQFLARHTRLFGALQPQGVLAATQYAVGVSDFFGQL